MSEASVNCQLDEEKNQFYREENIEYLKNVVSEIDSGKAKLAEHELIED